MRRKWFSATLVCLGLAFCGVIFAQDSETPEPILRLSIDPQEAVLVGQPVRLNVDVLVPTWLSRAPEFPMLEIPGAIVVGPEERATNLTERIDGQNWFGLRRSYLVYPQEPRQYEIPAEEVVIHYSLGGAKSATVGLPFPSQIFVARIPPEAAGIGYFIATTRLDLTQQLDPSVEGLRVGDSLRRTISISADQTFAMFFPPIEFESIEGLAVYPDRAQVLDRTADREGFKEGRRVESVSYVIQASGRYQLPGVTISWWDLNAGRMQQAILQPIDFEAVPNPEYVSELAPPAEEEPATAVKEETLVDVLKGSAIAIVLGLSLLVLVALVLRRAVPRLRAWRDRKRREASESEASHFEKFRQACLSDDPAAALQSVLSWLDRFSTEQGEWTLTGFARETGDELLQREVEELQNLLFARENSSSASQTPWSGSDFFGHVARARERVLRGTQKQAKNQVPLPPLNPV